MLSANIVPNEILKQSQEFFSVTDSLKAKSNNENNLINVSFHKEKVTEALLSLELFLKLTKNLQDVLIRKQKIRLQVHAHVLYGLQKITVGTLLVYL